MPEGTYTKEIHIPRETIWNFIKDMDHWAPLVPGYIAHHIRDEKQSTWKFNGDLGFIQKKIELRVDITEWKEPSLVTFQLKGLNEKFSGNGYFQAHEKSDSTTNITGHLAITAKGLKGALINGVLKTFVPNLTRELTTNISEKIQSIEAAQNE
ncbi:MAG TPA: SRPBCC family protein [Virgibacillus sp.]|nr:SRPBCC family protein [Virgibacillus sp.]